MADLPPIAKPPNVLPAGEAGVRVIFDALARLYRDLVLVYRLPERQQAIAAVAPLTITASNPPTQAQLQAVIDKVNEIIVAAGGESA